MSYIPTACAMILGCATYLVGPMLIKPAYRKSYWFAALFEIARLFISMLATVAFCHLFSIDETYSVLSAVSFIVVSAMIVLLDKSFIDRKDALRSICVTASVAVIPVIIYIVGYQHLLHSSPQTIFLVVFYSFFASILTGMSLCVSSR